MEKNSVKEQLGGGCVESNTLKEKVQEEAKMRKFNGASGRNRSKGRNGEEGSSRNEQLV